MKLRAAGRHEICQEEKGFKILRSQKHCSTLLSINIFPSKSQTNTSFHQYIPVQNTILQQYYDSFHPKMNLSTLLPLLSLLSSSAMATCKPDDRDYPNRKIAPPAYLQFLQNCPLKRVTGFLGRCISWCNGDDLAAVNKCLRQNCDTCVPG